MTAVAVAALVVAIVLAVASSIGLGIVAARQSKRPRRRTHISGRA